MLDVQSRFDRVTSGQVSHWTCSIIQKPIDYDLNPEPFCLFSLTKHSLLYWVGWTIVCVSLFTPHPGYLLCNMCYGNTYEGWRLLLVRAQLTAKHRVGNVIAFLPHSHANTPCRHPRQLIGIPRELSSKMLDLAGRRSYSAVWGIDLPHCCNY